MTENDISKYTKQRFKTAVKSKVRNTAIKYLKENQEKHSKMQNLIYPTLKMQEYLFSPIFDNKRRDLIIRLRTHTVNGIKSDFKGRQPLVEHNLRLKTTFAERRPLVNTTFGGRRPSVEDDL